MAYIGKTPVIGNFVKLDAITAVNGQAAYTMQNGGANFTDYESVNQFLVSLNGTIQAPTTSFSVSGSTLTFVSNLATGDVIDFIMVFGNSLSAGTPTDATVSTAKIVDDAVTAAKINNDIISGSTELASEPADTDEFLVSDAGTLKRLDYSHIKATSPGMTLLTSGDITSTTSTIAITGTHVTSTHDHYMMIVRGKAAGDGIMMNMRYRNSSDNGLIDSNYSYRVGGVADNGNGFNSNGHNLIKLSYDSIGNNTNEGFNMVMYFLSPLSNLVATQCQWTLSLADSSDNFQANHGMARRNDGTETHTGFTLFFDSGGDFANGTNYEFYGFKK